MLLVVFLAQALGLSPELTKLAEQARVQALSARTASAREGPMFPGPYEMGGVSFTLTKTLVDRTTDAIFGFAADDSVLAVAASAPIQEGTIFVDDSRQRLLDVAEKFEEDRDVSFYNISIINPLAVFTNLRMKTATDTPTYNCTFGSSEYSGAKCYAKASHNWNDSENKPNSKQFSVNDALYHRLGAKVQSSGYADIQFNGLANLQIDYGFDADVDAGVGFLVAETIDIGSTDLPRMCYPLYEFDKKIKGFQMKFGFSVCLTLNAKNLEVTLPKPIEYYRGLTISVQKSGSVSTYTGVRDTPLRYNIDQYKSTSLEPDEVFDFVQGTKFHVEPEIQVGVEMVIEIGDIVETALSIGAVLNSRWDFSANLEKCTCPYLYGTTSWDLGAYVTTPGLSVMAWDLLSPYDIRVPVFTGLATPQQCIFSPQKSVEGISSFKAEKSEDSYVIRANKFYRTGSRWLETFATSLQALESGVVYQNVQFPRYTWIPDPTGISEDEKIVHQNMILVNPPESTVLRWQTNVYKFFWPDSFTSEPINWRTEGQEETVMGSGNAIVTKSKAANVEVFKEFDFDNSKSRKFISFVPSAPIGSVLGVIVHSTDGTDKYAVEPLEQVLDDSQTSESVSKEWVAPNQLTIQVSTFTSQYANATVSFTRKTGSEQEPIGAFEMISMKQGVSYTGSEMGIPNGVVLDLSSGEPSLEVNVTVWQSETVKDGKIQTFEYKSIATGSEMDFEVSGTKFKLNLHCIRSLPKVLFELRREMPVNHRGILTRVFEETQDSQIDFTIEETEKYGIIRFKRTVSASGHVFSVISMPGLVPLCSHEALDDDTFLIGLIADETLIDGIINVPFRIKDVNQRQYQATLQDVFSSSSDGLCGNGLFLEQASGRVGCVESLVDHSTNKAWTVLSPAAKSHTTSQGHAKTLSGDAQKWRLQIAELAKEAAVKIVPSVVSIPKESSSFYIASSILSAFAGQAAEKLGIECEQCDKLRLTTTTGVETVLEKDADGLFSFIPEAVGDLMVVAVCNSSHKAFCEFTEAFVDAGLTVLKYGSADGVKELNYKDLSGKLLTGISRQLIQNRSIATLIKSWDGEIGQETIRSPGLLTFIVDQRTKGVSKISATLGDVGIPLSAEKYYENPELFFENMGVVKPEGGYTGDIVKFRSDGVLEVSNSAFSSANLESGAANFSYFLDVPDSYVTGQSYKVVKGLSPGAIAGIVIGVLVFCAGAAVGAVFLVIYLRKRKHAKYADDLAV